MNKLALYLILVTFHFFTLSLAHPSMAHASECSLADTSVQYFGYYGLTDPRDIQEAVDMKNTNIILTSGWAGAAGYPDYTGKFLLGLDAGMLGDGAWFSDWETTGFDRLKYYVNKYEGRIYAFYFDEPHWNNISPELFRKMTKKLRETFPGIGILAIEAYPPLLSDSIPANYYEYVTDLGFDYYFTHYDSTNPAGWDQYLNIHNHLKPHLTNKKLWIVPDGHAPVMNPQYLRWKDAFERYLCFAKDNNAVGIISFIYKTYPQFIELRDLIHPSGAYYDADFRSMHLVAGRAALANYQSTQLNDNTRMCTTHIDPDNSGYCLNQSSVCSFFGNGCNRVNNCANPFTTCLPSNNENRSNPKPGDLNQDGSVNLLDFNLLITNFGNPYTILDFNSIISNFGK